MKIIFSLLIAFQWSLCFAQEQCSAEKLNADLEQVLDLDQSVRMALKLAGYDQKFAPSNEHQSTLEKALQEWRDGDKKNKAAVKNVFDTCGWLDPKQLSYKANSALFFVIQHGSKDDRAKYFPYFEKQYNDNMLHSYRYVMMVDRMRYDKNLGQLYGTQFESGKEGLELYGVVYEPEKLNDRREKIGMLRILVFDEKYPPNSAQSAVTGKTK